MKRDPGTGRADQSGPYHKQAGPHGGAVFVVLGNSGQLSPGPLNHPAMVVSALALGSLVLDVQGSELNATFLRDTGASGDHFTIIKSPAPVGADAGADGGGKGGGGSGCAFGPGGQGAPPLILLIAALIACSRRRR
jgi:hypothetical protein